MRRKFQFPNQSPSSQNLSLRPFLPPRCFSKSTSCCVIQDTPFQLYVIKTSDSLCKKDLSLVQMETFPCALTHGLFLVCHAYYFFFIPGMIDELL